MDPNKKNPLELEENFFETEEISKEDEFRSEFEAPYVNRNVSMADEEEDDDDDKGYADDKGEPGAEFKFDESLADEEAKELAELNAKLGTNFEDLNELKKSFKSSDKKEVLGKIDQSRQLVNYFEAVLQYDPERLIREDKIMLAEQKGINIQGEDFIDELEMEIEKLRDTGMMSYVADSIKNNVRIVLEKNKKIVDDFDNSEKTTQEQEQRQFKDKIQESINGIFKQGTFLGIKPSKEDLLSVYKDVSNNKHINHLKANPSDAVEFALYLKYKGEIQKRLGKPDYKAGVRDTLGQIGMTGSQPGKAANVNSKSSDDGDLSYFEKLAK